MRLCSGVATVGGCFAAVRSFPMPYTGLSICNVRCNEVAGSRTGLTQTSADS